MLTSRRWFGNFALASLAALVVAGCGGSSTPTIETTPPTVPTGLSALPGNQQVTLNWTANTESDLSGYDVYQGTTSGALAKVATVTAPTATHVASGLANGTSYFFAVASRDINGNVSARSDEVAATPFLPDTIPPTASLSVPTAGATGVARDTAVTIAFSEDMAPASVTATLTPPPLAPAELGQPDWVDGKTLSFQPTGPLEFNTAYTVAVEGQDLAGNALSGTKSFTFTTANPPDVTKPTLDLTSPLEGATLVGVTQKITFGFSEAMNQASVQAAFSSTPSIACTWDSPDGKQFTCFHVADFAFSTSYTVTMGTGAADLAGNTLASATTIHFTTASAPDTVRPVVCPATGGTAPCLATSATYPAAGATGVARAANIVVRFSEPVDQASAQAAFAITSPAGHTAGVFTWSVAGDQMTFNPDVDFAYGANVTWRIGTGLKDLANPANFMAAQFTSTFRAIQQATVPFYSSPTIDGYVLNTGEVYTQYATSAVGDSNTNSYYRTFISFDLSAVPTTATLTSATLYAYQSTGVGTPYAKLGGLLRAESVNYGPGLEAADFETPILKTSSCRFICTINGGCNLVCTTIDEVVTLSTTDTSGMKSVGVLRKVNDDLSSANRTARGSRSQFRIRFPTNTNSDSVYDWVYILTGETSNATNRARLDLVYEYP